jgi:hypothetical protein
MKRLFLLFASLALTLSLLGLQAAETKPKAEKPAKAAKAGKPGKRGPLVHMVSFKFKPEAGEAKVKEIETAFAALPAKIPQIRSFEWGTNISPEKLDKGFTHGFVLTFKDAADRDAYLVHPAHQEFGKLVGPTLADVFVVDFLGTK